MNPTEAASVLTDAILESSESVSFAEITTAPTREQQEAIRSVAAEDIAPPMVCGEVDLEPGCTWAQVLKELAIDTTGAVG